MKKPIFTGACVAIVTPMHEDMSINFEKLGELIEFQISNGTAAITICGTTGESCTLNDKEHLEAIKYTVDHVAGRVPVIAGTGSNDTAHAIMMSKEAQSYGADGLLLVTPYYNKCTPKGLIQHYTAIADSVNIPAILYNVPSRTGVSMTVPVYKELSKHPMINGVKEASGSTDTVLRTLAACGDELNIWSGNDSQIVPLMALGAKGVISVLSNICPKETADLTALCLQGDFAAAADMQIKYTELVDALFCEVNPIPVKTAMNLLGMEAGPIRLPLCEMEPATLNRLKAALQSYGLMKA